MNIGVAVDNELIDDKRVLREINILREAGHNIYVICYDFGKPGKKIIPGINIDVIKISKKLKDVLFFFFNLIPVYEWLWANRICRFIRKNEINVLHAHDLYMARCSHNGITRSGRNTKLVLDLHENFPYAITTYNWTKGLIRGLLSRPNAWEKKESSYLEYADRIIVLSSEFCDSLLSRYGFLAKERFCVLPNVPDVSQMESFIPLRSTLKFTKKSALLFYFGIVAERRGVFEAIEAFARIAAERKDIDFLIVGPVDKKDLKRFDDLIHSIKLSERIIYIPWIDLSELPAYLDAADICIAPFRKNPQHESGVANKIYDYMLGGKPVIASDCEPQKNLIEKYSCGLVYETNSQMGDAILTLLGDIEMRKKMGANGRKAIIEDLNSDVVKNNLTNMYRSLDQD